MKTVVIGGAGLVGSKVVNKLREHGHEAIAASPNSGVNTVTGEGLAEALKGASVVVDVSNVPDGEDNAVLKFFETSNRNLLIWSKSARKHCFRTIAHDSAKPVSRLGSVIPQHKRLREDRLRGEHQLLRYYAQRQSAAPYTRRSQMASVKRRINV